MKRWISAAMAAVLALGLSACGNGGASQDKDVDLAGYYSQMEQEQDWGDGYMADMTEDMLDSYYPGLRELASEELIAKTPMMSAVVNEVVLAKCATEEDAGKAAEILQQRADEQAAGGAWYPASMEAWEKAEVVVNGKYAALLASGEGQDALAEAYHALFA